MFQKQRQETNQKIILLLKNESDDKSGADSHNRPNTYAKVFRLRYQMLFNS